jgi:hypothetical protein
MPRFVTPAASTSFPAKNPNAEEYYAAPYLNLNKKGAYR